MSEGGGVSGPLPEVYDVSQLWSGGAHTDDPWDHLDTVVRVLTPLGCTQDAIWAAWDGGGARSVKLLAKDAFLYSALQAGGGKKHGEARRWFERNPDRLASITAVFNGSAALPCPTGYPPSPRTARRERRAGREAVRQERRADRLRQRSPVPVVYSQQPRGQTGRPPAGISQSALDQLQIALQRLAEWYAAREAQRQAERDARRARNAAAQGGYMSLGDIASALGGGIERIATAAIPVATAIYNERIMREQRRAMPTGASGVPLGSDLMTTGLPSALLPLLGGIGGGLALSQPGQLEEGGLLEGLESEIERETTLWRRSSGIGGRVSPVRTVLARHPQTGSIAAWEYKGQPVLYSGDLRTCRRVRKVARGAAAGVGLRFRRRAGR